MITAGLSPGLCFSRTYSVNLFCPCKKTARDWERKTLHPPKMTFSLKLQYFNFSVASSGIRCAQVPGSMKHHIGCGALPYGRCSRIVHPSINRKSSDHLQVHINQYKSLIRKTRLWHSLIKKQHAWTSYP